MHRFWGRFIRPIIETAAPRRMIEVGAEFGWNTRNLLEYCRQNDAHLSVVDPAPHPSLHAVLAQFDAEYQFYPLKSLEALPLIAPPDLVLLDGDHNWFTVYNELQLIYLRAAQAERAPPLILFHDVAWPYARRDMYYDPLAIDPADRHPYAYRGMLPGQSELADNGINGGFANALHEGGERNGVLTAVEDFKASCGVDTSLYQLPFFNGLGILAPAERMTPALKTVIDGFFSPEFLLETCRILERDGMSVRADLAARQTQLTRRTEALTRAKARIAELQAGLDGPMQRSRLQTARSLGHHDNAAS